MDELTLVEKQILSKIDAESYYQSFFEDLHFRDSGEGAVNVPCFMHEDKTPSMAINLHKGGKCHGCDKSWKNIIGFTYLWEKYQGKREKNPSYKAVQAQLFHKHVHPLINPAIKDRWHDALLKSGYLRGILEKRFITVEEIRKYELGYDQDEKRVSIPIYNSEGYIIDIRKVRVEEGTGQKNLPYDWITAKKKREEGLTTHGSGPRLFPYNNIYQNELYLCEGEFDAMVLNKIGLNGITAGSVHHWKSWAKMMKGKDITIIFDNDTGREDEKNPGQEAALKLANILYPIARTVRNVVLPSGDVTDFLQNGGTEKALKDFIDNYDKQEPIEATPPPSDNGPIKLSNIADLVDPKFYGKQVRVDARISGEREDYFTIPTKYTVSCTMDRGPACSKCNMLSYNGAFSGEIVPESETGLGIIGATNAATMSNILKDYDLPKKCPKLKLERDQTTTCSWVSISPSVDRDKVKSEIDKLLVINMSGSLEINCEYELVGVCTNNPNDQGCLFAVTEATKKELSFRAFSTPDTKEVSRLKRLFGPQKPTVEAMLKKHEKTMDLLSRNVTFIHGRPDLHTAIDLTFHSPLQIEFDGVTRNSFIETAIIGDTNTGKNEVLDRLCDYYGGGLVVDSAATTQAGLIGGSDKAGYFSWGAYVQQHGMLIGLDEGSHLTESIGALRCVREGKADYIKAYARRQTVCMTRLVILANDPGGALSDNPYPVQALPTLFNKGADISRFTMAYFMREEDVDARIMNRTNPPTVDTEITKADFRTRLSNAWAVKKENIEFHGDFIGETFKLSMEMAEKYSAKIPLVQSSTMKKKLPSLAAAFALSQYSMSKDGKKLIVLPEHLHAVRILLERHYDSDACQYNLFSEDEQAKSTLADENAVDEIFDAEREKAGTLKHCVEHLLASKELDKDYISDCFMTCEIPMKANMLVKKLIMNRCVERSGRLLKKTKAFTKYLKKLKKGLSNEQGASKLS